MLASRMKEHPHHTLDRKRFSLVPGVTTHDGQTFIGYAPDGDHIWRRVGAIHPRNPLLAAVEKALAEQGRR